MSPEEKRLAAVARYLDARRAEREARRDAMAALADAVRAEFPTAAIVVGEVSVIARYGPSMGYSSSPGYYARFKLDDGAPFSVEFMDHPAWIPKVDLPKRYSAVSFRDAFAQFREDRQTTRECAERARRCLEALGPAV